MWVLESAIILLTGIAVDILTTISIQSFWTNTSTFSILECWIAIVNTPDITVAHTVLFIDSHDIIEAKSRSLTH